jgi:NADH:flavin oxidoreductases, Old Yellow Enzyme family
MASYYAQRATAGLIVTESTQPSLQGQSAPYTPGLHNDEQVAAWRTVTTAVHANGGRIFAQLLHAGRVSHPEIAGQHPVAPSAIALNADVFTGPKGLLPAPVPRTLSAQEVRDQVQAFADAARRAIDAGFDGVELQGASGYLIQQFLSSNANQRTDAYGRSVTGRIRLRRRGGRGGRRRHRRRPRRHPRLPRGPRSGRWSRTTSRSSTRP